MRRFRVNFEDLNQATDRLGETALDPTIWPEVMEQICSSIGAIGAALLKGDLQTPLLLRRVAHSLGAAWFFCFLNWDQAALSRQVCWRRQSKLVAAISKTVAATRE